MDKITITSQPEYHRNGVGGIGFYVAFAEQNGDRFVVIRPFANGEDKHGREYNQIDEQVGAVNCFVLRVDLLAKGDLEFGSNSWRGDHFVSAMDKAIAQS